MTPSWCAKTSCATWAWARATCKAAYDGTNEIGLAVMATTFAIVAVFVPVAFMDGIIGRFFLQFGITVAVAVLVSLFVSFTLDPMLSSVWRDPVKDRFKYVPWLGRLMALDRARHRPPARLVRQGAGAGPALAQDRPWPLAVALFVGSLMLVPMIGGEMFPETDKGCINLRFKTAGRLQPRVHRQQGAARSKRR